MGDNEKVDLNVGGKKFTCFKSTLLTYPDTLLARMFTSSASMAKKGDDGAYFFDRDSEIFGFILNFYRTGKMIITKNTPIKSVQEELDYFGINLDEDDIFVENEGEDRDIISNYITVLDMLKDIPEKANHIGNIVALRLDDGLSDQEEPKDDEEEQKERDKEIMTKAMDGLVSKDKAGRLQSDRYDVKPYEDTPKTDKHTQSDSEKEDENDSGNDTSDAVAVTAWVKEDYKLFRDTMEKLDKLRSSSTYCCGGWFDIVEDKAPRLFIGAAKPKDPAVQWFWAGDSKKGKNQDTRIKYSDDVAKKIEAAYKNDEKIFNLDKERYVDFKKMEQIRFDDGTKRRKVYREDPSGDDKPAKKKAKTEVDTTGMKDCGIITKLNLDALASECTVAPFGDLHDMKTKVDTNVRVALEMDASKLVFNPEIQPILKHIQNYISKNLVKEKIEFVPYKLNMYGKGGFFKPHVDTPVDAGKMLGTLILTPPTPHKGGALVVKHGSNSHTFEFADLANTSKFQWAAFFSDCEHEVKLVEDGQRVTIAYQIVTKGSSKSIGGDYFSASKDIYKYYVCAPGPSAPAKPALLKQIYDNMKELVSYGTIGLCFAHRYTVRGLSPENLKGKDKDLYEYFQSKSDVETTVLPVVIHQTEEREIEDGSHGPRDITRAVYAMSKQDVLYLRGKGPKPKYPFTTVPFLVATARGANLSRYDYAGSDGSLTGNYAPAEADALYLYAALLVTKK